MKQDPFEQTVKDNFLDIVIAVWKLTAYPSNTIQTLPWANSLPDKSMYRKINLQTLWANENAIKIDEKWFAYSYMPFCAQTKTYVP